MLTRNIQLKNILPKIESNFEKLLPLENFQNEILRPILKFQNDMIIIYFRKNLVSEKILFNDLSISAQKKLIDETFKSNLKIKQFYLGLIVGLFSTVDLEFYFLNKKAINKRITSLLIERLNSQIEIIIV